MLGDAPVQPVGLALSVLTLVVLLITLVLSRRGGKAPYAMRLALGGLVAFAALRVYSASAFWWAPLVEGTATLDLGRLAVLLTVTILTVVSLALLAYFYRVERR